MWIEGHKDLGFATDKVEITPLFVAETIQGIVRKYPLLDKQQAEFVIKEVFKELRTTLSESVVSETGGHDG